MAQAAAYIRVSSGMQVEQGSSLPSQLSAIIEYAAKNGFEILPEHVYSDEGLSARSDDRPDFQRMVAAAKQSRPPFCAIICYESSRFARNREDAIIYKSLLRRRGVQVRFVKQDFDDSPMGKLMEGMSEIIDEWYSANFAVETKRGQKQNAKDGYSTGGRPPYGLRATKTKNDYGKLKSRWEPDPEKAPVVRRIYREYASGMGYNVIADSLNRDGVQSPSGGMWNKNTLHYILHKNQPAYLGCLVYGRENPRDLQPVKGKYAPEEEWVVTEGVWEAIITKEMAEEAAKRLKTYRSRVRKTISEGDEEYRFLLTGKIYCGFCGAAMVGSKSTKRHYYYRCNKRILKGKTACDAPLSGVQKIESAVLDAIQAHLGDQSFLRAVYEDACQSARKPIAADGKSNEIKRAMLNNAAKKQRLVNAIACGNIEGADAKPMLEKLKAEAEELKKRMVEMKYYESAPEAKEPDFSSLIDIIETLLNLNTRRAQKLLIDAFIEKVTVFPDRLEIIFTIQPPDKHEKEKINNNAEASCISEKTKVHGAADPPLCIELGECLLRHLYKMLFVSLARSHWQG
ncbi:MAG: recombinase family protein [Synergistaceae bacterium]|nr:recombinase family protein [Synergistaceae bacterium]